MPAIIATISWPKSCTDSQRLLVPLMDWKLTGGNEITMRIRMIISGPTALFLDGRNASAPVVLKTQNVLSQPLARGLQPSDYVLLLKHKDDGYGNKHGDNNVPDWPNVSDPPPRLRKRAHILIVSLVLRCSLMPFRKLNSLCVGLGVRGAPSCNVVEEVAASWRGGRGFMDRLSCLGLCVGEYA